MRRKIQKPLALLLAFAMMFCMVPAAGFAADNGDSEAAVERIAGQNRWETAALTAVEKYGTNDTVIIARGDDDGNFADGLAASYLAKVKDAPILLTNPNSLPDATEKAIKDLNAQNAIVLGGELAVSEAVVNELEGLELEVERIEGGDRFGTAAAIAKAGGNADTALVVSGYAPADSLVAGPVAFNNDYPVLLVQKDSVPPATEDAIEELGIDNILVVGGETVISDAVYNALDADDRYAGYTRIDTSVVVADELFEEPETFTIVGRQDKNLADAVGAAVLGNPILY
ncbi:MAG: cell wall-binding repeat-containing protein, partial [Acetomicrobium sp.]